MSRLSRSLASPAAGPGITELPPDLVLPGLFDECDGIEEPLEREALAERDKGARIDEHEQSDGRDARARSELPRLDPAFEIPPASDRAAGLGGLGSDPTPRKIARARARHAVDVDAAHLARFAGGPSGARTPDRWIKSPLLYRLS